MSSLAPESTAARKLAEQDSRDDSHPTRGLSSKERELHRQMCELRWRVSAADEMIYELRRVLDAPKLSNDSRRRVEEAREIVERYSDERGEIISPREPQYQPAG